MMRHQNDAAIGSAIRVAKNQTDDTRKVQQVCQTNVTSLTLSHIVLAVALRASCLLPVAW